MVGQTISTWALPCVMLHRGKTQKNPICIYFSSHTFSYLCQCFAFLYENFHIYIRLFLMWHSISSVIYYYSKTMRGEKSTWGTHFTSEHLYYGFFLYEIIFYTHLFSSLTKIIICFRKYLILFAFANSSRKCFFLC